MYKKAEKYLLSYGIRPSFQRMAVTDYVMNHKTHPTVDEIYLALVPVMPTLSRMTVYNTLSMLAEKGAILALDFDGGRMHYDGDISPHAHFICTRCGKIYDLELNGNLMETYTVVPPPGIRFTSVQLSYKGLCEKCNAENNPDNNLLNLKNNEEI
jgi:Fur family ferric uptake transcriptional regulator/Fur family peroxide stress response transcriptional regulator